MAHTSLALRVEDFARYRADAARGFLPPVDPLEHLPDAFAAWERMATDLPALLMGGRLRSALKRMPLLDVERLEDERQLQRAMLLLSVFGSAVVWADDPPLLTIPRS